MIQLGRISKAGVAAGLLLLAPLPAASAAALPVADKGDVCAVIDDALAAQALKGRVKRDTNPQSSLPGLCDWRSLVTPGDGLTVRVDEGGQGKYAFDRAKLPVRDIQGVGDMAFVFVSPAGFVQLGMMKAGIYVTIVLQLQNAKDRLQRATEFAQAVAARM